ncbi:MAG: DUF1294 domain-containing protein [Clostridia bacterium]
MSIIGFTIMYIDKKRSMHKKWRISEAALLVIGLFGGIGSTLGMVVFRHKTNHWYFKVFLPIFMLLDIISYVYLFILL